MPSWRNTLRYPFQPLIETVRHYNGGKFRSDLMAGLTLSVLEVPQAMAYALIAGAPPEYGLYTCIIQGLIGALFSSNPHLASGPTNTQALLTAAIVARMADPTGDPGMYLQLVFALTFVKGLIQLAFAAAKLGGLVRYVSRSVIVGFTAGAGMLIVIGQLPSFFGVDVSGYSSTLPGALGRVHTFLQGADAVDGKAIIVGVVAVVTVIAARGFSKLLPGPLAAIMIAAALTAVMGWSTGAIEQVGEIPRALPGFAWPNVTLPQYESLLSGALAIALLGAIETVAIGKTMTDRDEAAIDANREFFTQGIANLVSSPLQCIPGSASFSRCALNKAAGGKTRFTGVFSSIFVLLILLLLGPMARHIPLPALAAILFVIAFGLVDWRYIKRITHTDRNDAAVCVITFVSTLLMPLQYAIYIGIFLNLAVYLRHASRLHINQMVPTPAGPYLERPIQDRQGNEKVMFLQVEGELFFGVADELADRLKDLAASPSHVVIFRLKRTHSIDSTVMNVLDRFVRTMQARKGHVIICGLKPELLDILRAFGLVQLIGEENVFETGYGVFTSAKRALARAKELIGESLDVDGIDIDDENNLQGWSYEI